MASSNNLQDFENLDDQHVLEKFEKSILDPDSSGFALYFDDNEAFGTDTITKDKLSRLLEAKKPPVQSLAQVSPNVTCWINFWTPDTQKESLDLLAKRYGFSARLLALMATDPPPPPPKNMTVSTHKSSHGRGRLVRHRADDTEYHGAASLSIEKQEPAADQALKLNHYDIVREIWHFFSVDFGPKYVCIGYNSLYNTGGPHPDTKTQELPGMDDSKPTGTRAWTWLVLCEESKWH